MSKKIFKFGFILVLSVICLTISAAAEDNEDLQSRISEVAFEYDGSYVNLNILEALSRWDMQSSLHFIHRIVSQCFVFCIKVF